MKDGELESSCRNGGWTDKYDDRGAAFGDARDAGGGNGNSYAEIRHYPYRESAGKTHKRRSGGGLIMKDPLAIEVPIDEFVLPQHDDTVIIRDGSKYHGRRAIVGSQPHKYGDLIWLTPLFEVGSPVPRDYEVLVQQVEIVPPDLSPGPVDIVEEQSEKKVTNLFDVKPSSKRWTVEEMLLDALEDVRAGKRENKKAIVLFLDDEGDKYLHGYNQAGMSSSECVLLCEMAKTMFKDEMG